MLMSGRTTFWTLAAITLAPLSLSAQDSPLHHSCRFVKIPMRDGIQLNTSVCQPEGPHEPLPFSVLEQLHDGREAAVARALRDFELVDESGVAPGRRGLRWGFGGHATNVAANL